MTFTQEAHMEAYPRVPLHAGMFLYAYEEKTSDWQNGNKRIWLGGLT